MIEEWWDAPPLHYLLASTCHPHLVEYLKSKGREITFFHNFVGIHGPAIGICDCGHFHDEHGTKGCNQCDCIEAKLSWMSWEQYLYSTLYEPTVITGSGLNSVTRAIDLAGFRGFDKIYVLGADCALRVKRPMPNVRHGSPAHIKWLKEETVMHADGGHALASDATPVTLGGYIDGRHWETKPDLAISALWLVKMAKAIDQLELIGDTLPNALMDKDDDYLDRMPNLSDPSGRIKNFIVNEQDYHFRACEHNETAI